MADNVQLDYSNQLREKLVIMAIIFYTNMVSKCIFLLTLIKLQTSIESNQSPLCGQKV